MKNLKEYEEEIYKCSRCALCQSVCPVYKASLNECAVSKGKFNMLNGVIKGDLSFSKQLKKYLDLCTGCNACKEFCPSGIDARKIFISAKAAYYKQHKQTFFEKVINSYFLFKTALLSARIAFSLYRFFKTDKFVKLFERMFLKCSEPGKRLLLLNSLASVDFNKKTQDSSRNSKKLTAIYFEGCFNKYINPQTESAVKKILSNSDIKLIKKDFECCGVSYLADGNIKEFKKLVSRNLAKVDCDFDYFLTDCASCNSVLKEYKSFSDSESAKKIYEKAVSVTDLIKKFNFICSKNLKVAVHVPCHEDFDFLAVVKNIKNIEYIEATDFNKCCGFSGTFAAKNPEISKEISRQKAQHYIESGADVVLTTCPACMLGLEQGFIETGLCENSRPKVMNLFVFLALYCKNA